MKEIHSHKFVEKFKGFVGFGLNRKSDEDTVVYYLQKFSDDELIGMLKVRLSHNELKIIFDTISDMLRKHLSMEEYHTFFLKER